MATVCRNHGIKVPIFLVVGQIRKTSSIDDEDILRPRLERLDGELLVKETDRGKGG